MGIIISTKGIKRENIMGGGGWTKTDWDSYATKKVSGKSTGTIYSSSKMKEEFDRAKEVIIQYYRTIKILTTNRLM
jgi:hypothetical protein